MSTSFDTPCQNVFLFTREKIIIHPPRQNIIIHPPRQNIIIIHSPRQDVGVRAHHRIVSDVVDQRSQVAHVHCELGQVRSQVGQVPLLGQAIEAGSEEVYEPDLA